MRRDAISRINKKFYRSAPILLIFFSISGYSQIFTVNYGQVYTISKTEIAVKHQDNDNRFNNSYLFGLSVDNIYQVNSFSFSLNYYNFGGWTEFSVAYEPEGNFNFETSDTQIHRFGIRSSIDLMYKNTLLFLEPYGTLFFELARSTDPFEYSRRTIVDETVDENFRGEIFLEAIQRFQIIPASGFRVTWHPIGRMYFILDWHYAFGRKSYQRLWFEHTYMGEQQPHGEWVSDGTGMFITLGVGIQFFNKANRKKK